MRFLVLLKRDVGTGDITDSGDFDISDGGVLTFKTPPNFETPSDGRRRTTYTT